MLNKPELQLTLMDEKNLLRRLAEEIAFMAQELSLSWAILRHHPLRFGMTVLQSGWLELISLCRSRKLLAGAVTGVLIAIMSAFVVFLTPPKVVQPAPAEEVTEVVMLDRPTGVRPSPEAGIGVGGKGRVGFREDSGEGSRSEPKRSRGGGGGGLKQQLDAQSGRMPQPSSIRAAIASPPVTKNPALPVAGIDIDPLLWKNQPLPGFGDPRATATANSNGPGSGGGIGEGNGTGIGEGAGPGFGPGTNGNIGGGQNDPGSGQEGGSQGNNMDHPNRVLRIHEVTDRVRVLSKPEPQYTEDARRNQIVGTVVLRVIFTRSGDVTNIRVVQPLPFGLTERAIAAARQIRFLPASKDGHPVSVYMQLEYNFNLY